MHPTTGEGRLFVVILGLCAIPDVSLTLLINISVALFRSVDAALRLAPRSVSSEAARLCFSNSVTTQRSLTFPPGIFNGTKWQLLRAEEPAATLRATC